MTARFRCALNKKAFEWLYRVFLEIRWLAPSIQLATAQRTWKCDTLPLEWWLSLSTIGIGAWITLPFEAFILNWQMYNLLPEWFWGGLIVIIGLFHLNAIASGKLERRRAGSIMLFSSWVFLFIMALVTLWTSPLVVAYTYNVGRSFWILWHVCGEGYSTPHGSSGENRKMRKSNGDSSLCTPHYRLS